MTYFLLLTLLSGRAFFYPSYDMDMMGYIGNAAAISGASVAQIHDTAYKALAAEVPPDARGHLLGEDTSGPPSQWESRRDRAGNAGHFAEYLPCFAIRPIFNELVYLLHYKLGVGLVRATTIIDHFRDFFLDYGNAGFYLGPPARRRGACRRRVASADAESTHP